MLIYGYFILILTVFLAGSLLSESVSFSMWSTELLMSICTLKVRRIIKYCLPYYILKKLLFSHREKKESLFGEELGVTW